MFAAAELPLIVPSRPTAFRLLIDAEMMRMGCKPNIQAEIDGLNSIPRLVRDGQPVLAACFPRNYTRLQNA